ncbi:site-specific DNA-methyltransferase, partial [Candidatus Poribacteria bacterium]|nr:site-specific DNA-methyltransferase [Candidatus Poribacteria bacterium]
LDPFMGGGSTIAAACAVGYHSIGIESDPAFYQMAVHAIPKLATLVPNGKNQPHKEEIAGIQQTLF